ncbi:uncharacterized protein LOC108808754 [Raphanus sativus]|uniref:Uncharacterized protein LOC108808754 n=1 Tax=Raphanus sativus TaxID=3726 RepID=A0A6J0JL28_RAPSA|nr:uncharacterized protein LOC108808754 [Raphanus sativus]
MAEAYNWMTAQLIPAAEKEVLEEENGPAGREEPQVFTHRLRCQVDASWTHAEKKAGLGFVLLRDDHKVLIGTRNDDNASSPLHAEAKGLIWTMEMMKDKGYHTMHFETDCLQLLKLIQREEEWPSMEAELEEIWILSKVFDGFSISFLPRGMNHRADLLAKAARTRSDTVVSVYDETPVWLANIASPLES